VPPFVDLGVASSNGRNTSEHGNVDEPFGSRPTDLLVITPDSCMSGLLTASDRPGWQAPGRRQKVRVNLVRLVEDLVRASFYPKRAIGSTR
jgi:hypothetical protein